MSPYPWTDGPRELIQHAIDHLALGGDFDRRIAMISVDNAVELTIKTYLGLPERARGDKGPSRRELDTASESFPALLDLLQTHAAAKIVGLSLDDIEWFHRLRNQLYHAGNGITVESSKVEAYLQLGMGLFENLFGFPVDLDRKASVRTQFGQYLQLWNHLQQELRKHLPPKDDFAYHWRRDYLANVHPAAADLYERLSMFRNSLVHSPDAPSPETMAENLRLLKQLLAILKIPVT
jgi:hypothetical protein